MHPARRNVTLSVILVLITVCCPPDGRAQTNDQWQVKAGPLTLDVYVSRTAHLFHVVDQISQWSEFCHHQYVAYFENLNGGLTAEDRELLDQHAAIRKTHGWGGGLEQTFYTPLELEPALAQGVKKNLLTEQEAETERRVFAHFQARVERLMSDEAPTLQRFVQQLTAQQSNLVVFADTLSRFTGGKHLNVPFYLMANPDDGSIGGGYNGGRLTLEIARKRDTYPTMLHELFHAFIETKMNLLEAAARPDHAFIGTKGSLLEAVARPGVKLDAETLNEGLAYAYSPGLVSASGSDELLVTANNYLSRGSTLADTYTRFTFYGLALRPLLKEALADKQQTLETFLPRAVDAWLVLAELDRARDAKLAAQAHDYRKDPMHANFIFGIWDDEASAQLKGHRFGRSHVAGQYAEMLSKNAKPGDTIILLLSLDDESARVPAEFSDLLPLPWAEVESQLKEGKTVFQQGKARDMTVFLLATPTVDELRAEFRRLAGEKKFSP